MRLKYHAVLDFDHGIAPVKFTAVDLPSLMTRFSKEVTREVNRRNEAREYTFVKPNLTVEVK